MRGSHLLLILLVAAVAGQEVPAPEKAGISSASEADRAARIAGRQQQLAAQQAAAAAPGTSPAVPGAGPQVPPTTPPTGPAAAAAPGDPAAAAAATAGPGAVGAAQVIPPGAPPAAPSPAAAAAAAAPATAATASPVTPPADPAAAAAAAAAQPQPGAAPEAGPAAAAATGPAAVPGTLAPGQPADPAAAATAAGAEAVPSPSPRPRRRRRSPAPRRQLDVSPSPAVAAAGADSTQPPGAPPGATNGTTDAAAAAAAAAAPGDITTVSPGSSPGPAADVVNATGPGVGANGTDAGTRTADAGSSPAPGQGADKALDGAASPGVSISPSPGFNPPPSAGNSSNAGAIIGGILGTLAALTLLAGIAALIAWCRRRRIRKNNPFPDAGPKKQPQQQPQRPAWLDKLPGFGKKHPQDGVTVYKNPVYAPKGSPGPRPGPGSYANGRAGPAGGPGGPGPYANGTPSYNRSLSDPGGTGGHFYGYPPQGSAGRSGSRGGPIPPAAYGPPAIVSGGPGRGAAAFGYGADELQDCLKDLKDVLTNRLLPAVDNASLITDPVAAWIDAGMAEVRPELSNAAYGASHTFVEDWRTHRVWDWLNSSHWKFIPSDERLLDAQVNPTLPQRDFARQMLSMIKRDPRFPPFVAAVDDAVKTLLEDAVSVARTMGVLSNSNSDSSSYRSRDQGPIPAAAQAAANYYRPVLTQLFEAALKLHLQVQGTNSTAYIFVPGAPPAVSLAIPERGLIRKDRLGSTAAELHYLCEEPGVFSEDPRATTGVHVWVPAHAIRVGLRPSY